MKLYLLRTTAKPASRAHPKYLEEVRAGRTLRTLTKWCESPLFARTFTLAQRARFEANHPFIRGRWVLAAPLRAAALTAAKFGHPRAAE